jgi:hypothetical protein
MCIQDVQLSPEPSGPHIQYYWKPLEPEQHTFRKASEPRNSLLFAKEHRRRWCIQDVQLSPEPSGPHNIQYYWKPLEPEQHTYRKASEPRNSSYQSKKTLEAKSLTTLSEIPFSRECRNACSVITQSDQSFSSQINFRSNSAI